MRKFILLIALLFQFQILFAQTYLPLPDSNTVWVIQQDDGGPGQDYYYKFFTFQNKNDTVINGNSYAKFFEMYPPFPDTNYIGAYRNDTAGKTFFIPADSINEFLLRDFSKNIGDTVYNVLIGWLQTYNLTDLVVDSVNYVQTGPYVLKKMFLNNNSGVFLVWIEGIGCSGAGVNNVTTGALGYIFLNCMSYNDTTYYLNNLFYNFPDPVYVYGNCGILTSIIEQENFEIEIYPNPFGDKLIFTLNNNDDSEIILYDITSRKIFNQTFTNSISINTEELSKGIYIYEVRNKKGLIKKGKVVKD